VHQAGVQDGKADGSEQVDTSALLAAVDKLLLGGETPECMSDCLIARETTSIPATKG
jgi:hypothetical protein